MAEVGILRPEERVELVEGEIIVMAPIGPNHAWSVALDIPLFSQYAGDRFFVQVQNPIRLDDGSEPQPDVMLLRRRSEGYFAAHPTPPDVLLVIEVADSSLEYDREVKAHLYGRAGVPETWVKNLPEDCIERFTEPGPEGYAQHSVHRRGETLTPVSLPDLELPVDALLPPLPVEEGRWRTGVVMTTQEKVPGGRRAGPRGTDAHSENAASLRWPNTTGWARLAF